jgi:hypothetical protein
MGGSAAVVEVRPVSVRVSMALIAALILALIENRVAGVRVSTVALAVIVPQHRPLALSAPAYAAHHSTSSSLILSSSPPLTCNW